jgi:hypothetical protein
MAGLWIALLVVFAAGMTGGVINALMSDNGFMLPRYESKDGTGILRPGFVGNMLIGGVAASISWGLYGPAGSQAIVMASLPSTAPAAAEAGRPAAAPATLQPALTMAGLFGAMLVGVGGARWLSNEVDKNLLRAAASRAALSNRNEPLSMRLALATPAEALRSAIAAGQG